MLPPEPQTGGQSGPTALEWWWRLESADGQVVDPGEEWTDARFPSQAEAESWLGEIWAELADHGVDAVTLHEQERKVYGPMSLHA